MAINTATIAAANATAATSDAVLVTARAASDVTLTKGRTTGAAQLDSPVTYRMTATIAAGGTAVIRNARIVDDLPAGATFVSATDAACTTRR